MANTQEGSLISVILDVRGTPEPGVAVRQPVESLEGKSQQVEQITHYWYYTYVWGMQKFNFGLTTSDKERFPLAEEMQRYQQFNPGAFILSWYEVTEEEYAQLCKIYNNK